MKERVKKRLMKATAGQGAMGLYLGIYIREIATVLIAVILSSSLAYVLWKGKPDIYFLYKYKLQGGALVWMSKWVVFALMAGSALALFMIGAFFALSSALNLLVITRSPAIRRLQALGELEKKGLARNS